MTKQDILNILEFIKEKKSTRLDDIETFFAHLSEEDITKSLEMLVRLEKINRISGDDIHPIGDQK